jgi:galactokinase
MIIKSIPIIYSDESKFSEEFSENLNVCKAEFIKAYGKNSNNALVCVCAPGRVNLIGEHIDYNEGFVFPMAIPLYTIIVGAKNNHVNKVCRVKSLEASLASNNSVEFSLNENLRPITDKTLKWANYVIGVVANFHGNYIFCLEKIYLNGVLYLKAN